MSHYDYVKSQELVKGDPPFASLVMAAMRRADTDNLFLLRRAFPTLWDELSERYNAPGGLLAGETR